MTIEKIEVDINNKTFTVEGNCLYSNEKKNLIICYIKEENIEKEDLSQNLEVIESRAFRQSQNLKKIELPDSVLEIGLYAFLDNSKIEEIIIGKNVEYIDPLFKYINYNGTVTINKDNENYIIEDNILYNYDKTELIKVLYEINGEYTTPNFIQSIGNNAFVSQVKLTKINISSGVTSISNAFNHCSQLTYVYIPETVNTINRDCFYNANNLNKIQIDKEPGSITGSPWGATKGDSIVEWLK